MFIFQFLATFISVILDVVSFAMIVRMLLSLFIPTEEGRLHIFLACITEPFIAPVRFILEKFNILQNTPFDFSFTIAYFMIILVRLFLPAI